MSTLDAAIQYVRRGWQVVSIPFRTKGPRKPGWESLRLSIDELPARFSGKSNIGIILGEPSGWLVDVDLDCEEARGIAAEYLPATPVVTGRAGAANSHYWYVCRDSATRQFRDSETRQMIVELRSTGCQTVVGPSVHPSGATYDILSGDPAEVDYETLLAAVERVHARVEELRGNTASSTPQPQPRETRTLSIASEVDVVERAIAYLGAMPTAISGQGGHAATFAAATALVHGFALSEDTAYQLLLSHYNPYCMPAWTEKELQHKIRSAASSAHNNPRGWLRDAQSAMVVDTGVDISGITRQFERQPGIDEPESDDPGHLADDDLRIPGFISEVMDLTLASAPYPNVALSFCGALALQAFLCGRKIRDSSDNRTNLYILSLANSATGKDWPRKVNAKILLESGQIDCLGESIASAEGLYDSLVVNPSQLIQADEVDELIKSINKSSDARYDRVLSILLKLYSSSNSVIPPRKKVGSENGVPLNQPSLVLLGSAIPSVFYASLSEEMLYNGFISRMIILDAKTRGVGQEGGVIDVPDRIAEVAKYWKDLGSSGNLTAVNPEPQLVNATDAASQLLIDCRRECDEEYTKAEGVGNNAAMATWGRVNEQIRKLSLIYAASENPVSPEVTETGVSWSRKFAFHQARRMLHLASNRGEKLDFTDFDAVCQKAVQKIRSNAGPVSHSVLLKRMKIKSSQFKEVITTLEQRGEVVRYVDGSAIYYKVVS